MASGPLAADKDAFDTFNHEVYEARWGSVFGALASLLPLERLLRAAWDVEAFRGRSGDEEQRGARAWIWPLWTWVSSRNSSGHMPTCLTR